MRHPIRPCERRTRWLSSCGARSRSLNGTLLLAAALALTLTVACGSRREPEPQPTPATTVVAVERVVGVGRIEPELRMVELSSEVSGVVRALAAAAGDTLPAAGPIVRLSDEIEQARLRQAEAQAASQHARVEAAVAALRAARAQAENAALNFARAESLFARSVDTEVTRDAARADDQSARAEVDRWMAEIAAAQAVLRQTEADRQLAQEELARRTLRAPAAGRLLALDVALGDLVTPDRTCGSFAIASPLTAWCEVDELFADRVRLGQAAIVRSVGSTDTLARGAVVFAGPYLRRKSIFADDVADLEDRRVREVRIRLAPDADLLLGSRVECVIAVE